MGWLGVEKDKLQLRRMECWPRPSETHMHLTKSRHAKTNRWSKNILHHLAMWRFPKGYPHGHRNPHPPFPPSGLPSWRREMMVMPLEVHGHATTKIAGGRGILWIWRLWILSSEMLETEPETAARAVSNWTMVPPTPQSLAEGEVTEGYWG